MKKSSFILCLILFAGMIELHAQISVTVDWKAQIMKNDSLLFSVGFNRCDLRPFERLLSEDFEFYHDKGGIAGKQKFLSDMKNGLCATPDTYQSRRELVEGKNSLNPLYRNGELYGVVQEGFHRFYEKIEKQPERLAGTARFIHVWLLKGSDWQLIRSFSFDHQAIE